MPVRSSTTDKQAELLKNDSSFVFQGTPEDIDVEDEVHASTQNSAYDAFKLAQVLLDIGIRMVGVSLYPYQRDPAFRIIYSMLAKDGAEITILYARQSGKSEVISFVVNVIGILFPVLAKIYPKELGHFSKGVKMGLLAPQKDQVQTVYDRCMERLSSPSVQMFLDDPDINDDALSTVNYKLKSGSFLKGQSAAKQSKVESKTYHIIFLDEAQDLNTDKVRRSIIPMAASTFGTIVRTGTPSRNKGDYYSKIKQNKAHDQKLKQGKARLTKQLHFEADYKMIVKQKNAQFKEDQIEFHSLYEKAVNRDKASWGENSEAFRMAYKVEWLLEIGMFITEQGLEDSVYNSRIIFPRIGKDDFVVAGLDIASARAETVLTTGIVDSAALDFGDRPKKTVADWLTLGNENYEVQFQILAQELLEKRVRVLYSDYTGVGRALTDTLMYHLGNFMTIIPYTFTPASKSDMWKALDEDISNKKVVVPAHKSLRQTENFKKFEDQMVNLTKGWKGPMIVCDKTSGYLDDFCDSLGLMNLAGNHLYSPPSTVETSDNVLITMGRGSMVQNSRW